MVIKVAQKRSGRTYVGRGGSKKLLFVSVSHTDASAHKLQRVCVDVLHVNTHTHTHIAGAIRCISKSKKEGEG